jgi:hypothetical protein
VASWPCRWQPNFRGCYGERSISKEAQSVDPSIPPGSPPLCVFIEVTIKIIPRLITMAASFRIFACLLLGLVALVSAQSKKCYFPNGKLATGMTPCGSSDSCCENGDTCLKDGFCQADKSSVYRGGCTDKDWGSKAQCAPQCADGRWIERAVHGTVDGLADLGQ